MSVIKKKKGFFGRLSEKLADVITMRKSVDEDMQIGRAHV